MGGITIDGYWYSNIQGDSNGIDSYLLPEVKWEDEEPRELVLKPIKEK